MIRGRGRGKRRKSASTVDLLPSRRQLPHKAALDHALGAALAIALNTLAALFVLLRPTATVLGLGMETIVLLATYLVGTRAVYRHTVQARRLPGEAGAREPARLPPARAAVGFGAAAVAILVAGSVFAWSAERIAEATGLGTTFVGTWLVGFSTSLPELVASVAAVRAGAIDLAVGNLLGSNALNMALFFVLDAARRIGGTNRRFDRRAGSRQACSRGTRPRHRGGRCA